MWQNNLREIKILLYRLKRNFGLPATIKHPLSTYNDIKTGAITIDYKEIFIRKVIVLPASELRNAIYGRALIVSGKQYTYGGFFDQNMRSMIVDCHDVPKDFSITENDHIVFETKRYNINNFEMAEHKQAWLLNTIELSNAPTET